MIAKLAAVSQMPAPARITAIENENYRTKTFTLDVRLDAEPGQFVMVWLPRLDEKPFSLVNANPVTLMISACGAVLAPCPRAGRRRSPVAARPLWPGVLGARRLPAAGVVGGGYGVAPLLWLAQQHVDWMDASAVIVGARTAGDLLYTQRFQAIADHQPSLVLHTTTEDGSGGEQGRVTDVLGPLLEQQEVDSIFACGPHGMLDALAGLARRYGVTCQLSWEAYMRCGMGICGACEHDGKVLCMDGPVLPVVL